MTSELTRLVEQISQRMGRHLERRGLLVRDCENAYLEWDCELASSLDDLATAAGFSLHAGITAKAHQRDKVRSRSDREGALGYKLERLCRYITRPAVATGRLSLTGQGQVRYSLKTPWRDRIRDPLLTSGRAFIFPIRGYRHLTARCPDCYSPIRDW